MSALRRWLAIVMAIAVMLGTLLVPLAAAAAPIRKSGLPVPLREPMEPWAHGDPEQPSGRAGESRAPEPGLIVSDWALFVLAARSVGPLAIPTVIVVARKCGSRTMETRGKR
jgi:hypothetical protein